MSHEAQWRVAVWIFAVCACELLIHGGHVWAAVSMAWLCGAKWERGRW